MSYFVLIIPLSACLNVSFSEIIREREREREERQRDALFAINDSLFWVLFGRYFYIYE